MKDNLKLSLVTLTILLPLYAGAVGVAVYPSEITVRVNAHEKTTTRMLVSNPSSDVAVFEVYPDEFEALISVNPSSFTLESGEERKVNITIEPRESGQLRTNISVVGRSIATNTFQAGSGVKVPMTIIASEPTNNFAGAISTLGTNSWFGIILILALTGWVVYKFRKQRQVAGQTKNLP